MIPHIDIDVQDPQWASIPALEDLTRRVVEVTFEHVDTIDDIGEAPSEISVVYVNDNLIQVLNREYRGKDKPTNVLSFAMLDGDDVPKGEVIPLGDVVLAYETIHNEAISYKCPVEDHLTHLIVHGCLHLLGYDHIEDDDATVMELLEIKILQSMDIQNPYLYKLAEDA